VLALDVAVDLTLWYVQGCGFCTATDALVCVRELLVLSDLSRRRSDSSDSTHSSHSSHAGSTHSSLDSDSMDEIEEAEGYASLRMRTYALMA
jgi:hypothetical protein